MANEKASKNVVLRGNVPKSTVSRARRCRASPIYRKQKKKKKKSGGDRPRAIIKLFAYAKCVCRFNCLNAFVHQLWHFTSVVRDRICVHSPEKLRLGDASSAPSLTLHAVLVTRRFNSRVSLKKSCPASAWQSILNISVIRFHQLPGVCRCASEIWSSAKLDIFARKDSERDKSIGRVRFHRRLLCVSKTNSLVIYRTSATTANSGPPALRTPCALHVHCSFPSLSYLCCRCFCSLFVV